MPETGHPKSRGEKLYRLVGSLFGKNIPMVVDRYYRDDGDGLEWREDWLAISDSDREAWDLIADILVESETGHPS